MSLEHILLLEAGYKNKFPPIGLMKLAFYHTHHRGDLVWFAKGKLSNDILDKRKEKIRSSAYYQNKYGDAIDDYFSDVEKVIAGGKWDRVYVTTLFTYEWDKTIALIEYAKTLVDDPAKVHIGGIAATLMPQQIEDETGIKPMCGLISDSSQLGYAPGVCIDTLIPDYSILEHTDYKYPVADSYFLTATRGCGNRCSFCAVQVLEPEYQDYLPIQPRINQIDLLYGEKKNLYLLDNNVLKSSAFPVIIEEIKKCGFAKGDTWLNPVSGKPNKRYVDFNQGLDAKFLTDEKARLLGEIALNPAHIAFDHIGEAKRYSRAVRLMDKYDIRYVSSYLLYNTQNFKGKGSRRSADTPRDLYDRMRINYELNVEINQRRKENGQLLFDCFAFPMCYIPLDHKNRKFVGDNWTPRTLAGVRTMLQPSHGGVFTTPDYFNYMYGSSYEEFLRILLMPHEYVRHKGKPAEKYAGEHPNRKWLLCIEEWNKLYSSLTEGEQEQFAVFIADNCFQVETFLKQKHPVFRRLYLHYFTGKHFTAFLEAIRGTDDFHMVQNYILYDCPSIFWCCVEQCAKQKYSKLQMSALLLLLFPHNEILENAI